MAAPPTAELRLSDAVTRLDVSTLVTGLTGVPGVHAQYRPPSFFRFGFQDRAELSPARVVDASIESGLGGRAVGQELPNILDVGLRLGPLGHVLDFEVFDDQEVVLSDQLARHLVVEVATFIGDLPASVHHGLPG